jgi:hypothetical protein
MTGIDPDLQHLADEWPVIFDTESGQYRCADPDCGQAIFQGEHATARLAHLLRAHGYRMDGRRFDDQNREIGRAGR